MSLSELVLLLVLQDRPPEPPSMRNELRVRIVEHVDQEHPHPLTRQREPLIFEGEGTFFEFDHERHFKGPPQATAPLPPLPVEARITASAWGLEVGRGLVRTGVSGNPLNPPAVTTSRPVRRLSAMSLSSDGDPGDGSTNAPVVGPELSYPLSQDLSGWGPTSWMPAGSRFSVFARAGFGSMEVYGLESDVTVVAAGPQILVPLTASRDWLLGVVLSGGPAYFHSDIGSALGFEGMAGLRGEVPLAPGLSFTTLVEASLYVSENVRAWGPGLSLGLTFSW